jgi:hypothetical protein
MFWMTRHDGDVLNDSSCVLVKVRTAQLAGRTIYWPLYAPVVVFLLTRLLDVENFEILLFF